MRGGSTVPSAVGSVDDGYVWMVKTTAFSRIKMRIPGSVYLCFA